MENLQGMPSDEYKTLMLLQKNNVQLYTWHKAPQKLGFPY